MTTLVERLRSLGRAMGGVIAGYRDKDSLFCASNLTEIATTALDAADEIDRLEAQISQHIRNAEEDTAEMVLLHAEIERLRDELAAMHETAADLLAALSAAKRGEP